MTPKVRVSSHINYPVLERVLFGPGGYARRVTESAAKRIARRARVLAPVRTGRLRRSIAATEAARTGKAEMTAEVTASAAHAVFVHEGTRRHVIKARTGGALRFNHNGQLVFARSVDHPGTSPNRFLTQAMNEEKLRDLTL